MATSAQAGIAPTGVANASGVTNPTNSAVAAPAGSASSIDSLLSGLVTGGANIYGSQNAAEAQNNGILAGIGQQNTTMGNINGLFGAQTGAGNNAFVQLQNLQNGGGNGQAPDYSNFNNSPGYQFAVQQGTQAINRQAAASGSLYTPNTLNTVGQYVTGAASQNYNNYVQQLLQTAGLGGQANASLSQANLTTGSNISQLDQNSGNAEAGGIAGAAGSVGSLVGGLLGNSTVQKGVGSLLGNLFGDSSTAGIGAGADSLATSTIGNLGLDASTATGEAGVASDVAASNAATDFSGIGNISGIGADSGAGSGLAGAGSSSASGLAGGAGAAGAGAAASGAVGAAGADALAASGSFATGGGAAAASAGGAGAGAGAGIAAVAAPAAIAAAAFVASQALGAAWTSKETQGNAAMMAWMKATGATWTPNSAANTNNGSTFGNYNGYQPTGNGKPGAGTKAGTMYDKNGNAISSVDAAKAIHDWAVANGINPGDFK